MEATLGQALIAAAEHEIGSVSFVAADGTAARVGFGQIAAGASATAGGLRDLGLLRGESVAIVLPTCPAFYDAFFGAVFATAVPCALYPPLRLGRLDEWERQTTEMLRTLGAAVVVTEPRLVPLLSGMAAAARCRLGVVTPEGLLSRGKSVIEPDLDPARPAVVQFSSGTTGAAKLVRLSHDNIRINVAGFLSRLPCTRERPSAVCWLPLYHDLGLFGNVMAGVWSKAELTLIPPQLFLARPVLWLEQLTRTRADLSAAPNFAFGLCVKRIRDEELVGLDLSSWAGAICAAETIQRHTMDAFIRRFGPCGFEARALIPAYGLAEATVGVTVCERGQGPRWRSYERSALVERGEAVPGEGVSLIAHGKPLAGVHVDIRDATGQSLPERRSGEIFVQGDNVHMGLAAGRWLATGDRGFFDEGELYLFGRLKDTIILNGRNYDPALLEAELLGIEGLRTGCGVCLSAQLSGEAERDSEGLVVLVERDGAADPARVEVLKAAVRKRFLEVFQLSPARIEILAPGSLPRTSSGKLQRGAARRQWERGTLAPPRGAVGLRFAVASVKGIFRQRLALAWGLVLPSRRSP